MCLYPKLIGNKKYQANKKNGGQVPPLPLREFDGKMIPDERVLYVPVGCGKCMECRKQKSRAWQVRLLEEVAQDNKALFVTLTFSNDDIYKLSGQIDKRLEGYDRDNAIAKRGVRLFLERWRKENKKSVKHWLITELGHNGTENIHLHGIIWTDKSEQYIKNKWGYGYIWTNEKKGVVGEKVVNYIIKYVTKLDEKHQYYEPKILCSPGIGKGYTKKLNYQLNKYKGADTKEYYRTRTGHKINLPIYYRNKIYSEEEREKLWINKIEENKRFIDGIEIDGNDMDTLMNVLQTVRQKSNRLGYGNDTINWERRTYEREQRNLKFNERIKKSEKVNDLYSDIYDRKYNEPEK